MIRAIKEEYYKSDLVQLMLYGDDRQSIIDIDEILFLNGNRHLAKLNC